MSEQRFLITGGNSGIGLATACRLAGRGARVAVLARNREGLDAAARQTAEAGRECLAYAVDITDAEALRKGVGEAVEALGGLDVAVANAGTSTYGRFRDTRAEDFDRVVELTFGGVVDTVRAVLPHLESSGGSLVVVGSLASALPLPRMSAYTAAKHAVRGFVDTLRIELAAEGSPVSVSLVEPGPVDTPFWRNVASADGRLPPGLPLSYKPEEIAIAIEDAAARRRPRTAVGGAWWTAAAVRRLARPAVDAAISRLMLVAERRGEQGPGRAAIWNPSGTGEQRLGLKARRSLLVRARSRLPRREAARRKPPRPSEP
jgi:NAD(P)-dependent dehydrogenase (short-subunit alcohol dehydrogenase family)